MATAMDIVPSPATLYVKNTESKGKGLFSSAAIKEGAIIFEEKPEIACQFSWNRQYNYTACDNCMKSLETAQNMARRLTADYERELPFSDLCCDATKSRKDIVKCPRCMLPFCFSACFLEAEEKYHKFLCLGHDKNNNEHPLNKLEEEWRKIHYPPETASIMLIARMVSMIAQSPDPQKQLEKFNQFVSNVRDVDTKMTHKLLGEKFQGELSRMYRLLKDAVPIEHYPKLLAMDGLKSLFALIGINGQGIGTSSLSQYVHNVDALQLEESEREKVDNIIDNLYDDIEKESGQFLNCEGSGLFELQSKCNHSCSPNAEVTFPYNNSTLVLVALADIEPNEEICICYLDECQRDRSRHSRQKILRENYLFECSCLRCEIESDQPSVTSSDESDIEKTGDYCDD